MNYFAIPALATKIKQTMLVDILSQVIEKPHSDFRFTKKMRITECVLNHFNITLDEVRAFNRQKHYAEARRVLTYLLYKHTLLSENDIALHVNRDRCTAIHNNNVAIGYYAHNVDFKKIIDKIEEKIK